MEKKTKVPNISSLLLTDRIFSDEWIFWYYSPEVKKLTQVPCIRADLLMQSQSSTECLSWEGRFCGHSLSRERNGGAKNAQFALPEFTSQVSYSILLVLFMLQEVKGRKGIAAAAKLLQSCPTLRNPMYCSLPGKIHGIFHAGVLEWGAIAFSEERH